MVPLNLFSVTVAPLGALSYAETNCEKHPLIFGRHLWLRVFIVVQLNISNTSVNEFVKNSGPLTDLISSLVNIAGYHKFRTPRTVHMALSKMRDTSIRTGYNSCLICAPLMSQSIEATVSDMHKAKAEGADVVEVRLDYIKNLRPVLDLEIIIRTKPLPVIITYRPKCEGGEYEGDETSRIEALLLAKALGADYIDLEFKVARQFAIQAKLSDRGGCKVIVSSYVDGTTHLKEKLSHLLAQMHSTGADIFRLVTNAYDITDIAALFQLLPNVQVPLIAYSVGERGLISQVLCPKYGGVFVFGSMEGALVPGLPTLHSLLHAYKPDYINADTKVFGLISKPVSHSKGPILHNPTFRHTRFDGIYVPMLVDDLKEFFKVYSGPDFAGFSVGIPYKESIIPFCDEVDPFAKSIGAVNTIVRRYCDGKLVGYNTDCEAAVTAIEDALRERGNLRRETTTSPLAGKTFVVVGAGGAGRALAFGAKTREAKLVICDIDFDRATSLAQAVSGESIPFEELVNLRPPKGSILANATPLGMHPNKDRIPVHEVTLGDYQLVFDSVYTPRKTKLLAEAEAAGSIIVSGVEMFLRQAIGQFELFTNRKAPVEFMREIVLAKF